MSWGCYGTCAVSRDLAQLAADEHEVSDAARTRMVVEVSEALADPSTWTAVAEHIAENETWQPLVDAMRRASTGARDALGEIEAIALAARDAVAERIVERYIATDPRPPYTPPRLLAKYPSGRIPQPELLHALQLEHAA